MAGARQNNSQEFISSLSKKIEKMMDTAEKNNEEIISFLGSIDKVQKKEITVELKKHTGILEKISSSISNNQKSFNESFSLSLTEFVDISKLSLKESKEQTKLLSSIDNKIDKISGGSGVSVGEKKGFLDSIKGLPTFLFGILKVFLTAGLLTDLVIDGAKSIASSIVEILSVGTIVKPLTAIQSILMIRLIAESKISEVIDMLNTSMGPLIGIGTLSSTYWFTKSLSLLLGLSKDIDLLNASTSLIFYEILHKSKFSIVAFNLSEGLKNINLSYLFKSWIFTKSIKNILELYKGIDPVKALLSVSYFTLLDKINISLISKSLGESMKNISLFTYFNSILLKLTASTLLDLGRVVNPVDALLSASYFKLLANSDLGELAKSLTVSIGLPIPGKMIRRAKNLVESSRILLGMSGKNPSSENPNPIDIGTAIKSIAFFKLLSLSGISELSKSLTGFLGIGSLFDKDLMLKRAILIKKSTIALLSTSENIDNSIAIKSLLIFGLLGISLSKIVGALTKAALFSPLIIIGVKIISWSIGKLVGSLNTINKSSKEILASGIYLVLLSFSIGNLILMSSVAALAFPLIIAGTFAISFMINKLGNVMTKLSVMKKNEGPNALDRITAILAVLTGVSSIMQIITAKIDWKQSLISIGLFSLAMISLGSSLMLVTKIANSLNVDFLDVLASSIEIMIGSVTAVIMSKALKDPAGSFKHILIFTAMNSILGLSLIMFAKTTKDLSTTKMIVILGFLTGLILINKLVIYFSRGVGLSAIKETGIFLLVTGMIVTGVVLISKYVDANVSKIVKSTISILLFVTSIIAVSLAVKTFNNNTNVMGVSFVLLSIGALALIYNYIGDNISKIMKGALVISIVGLSIIPLSFALSYFKNSKINIIDSLSLGIVLLSVAGSMAIAGNYWKQVVKGSLVLGLSAIAITLLTPALIIYKSADFGIRDAISLSLTLIGVGGSVALIGKFWSEVVKGSLALLAISVAVGILSLSLMMFKATGFNLIDTLTLSLTIVGLGMAFWLVGKGWDTILLGSLAVFGMTIAIGFLSIGLFYFKESKFELKDTLVLGLTIIGLGIAFWIAGKEWQTILKGATAIAGLGAAIWLVSKGLTVWKKANVGVKDIFTLGATIAMLGVEFYAVGKFGSMQILEGALAIAGLGAALWVVSHGMKVWTSAKAKLSDVGILGATIAMLGVEFAIAGLGPVPLAILSGALAIAGLGAALWVVSHGMKSWTKSKATLNDVKVLGSTIAVLGVEFAAAGLGSILILAGAAALTAASLPLSIIAKSVKTFSDAKFTKKDGDILSYTLQSVVDGFLGGKIPGGLTAGLSFAAKSAARIALMIPSIPVMILAANALMPISKSVKIFKSANITKSDSDIIENTIGSIVKSFSILGDKKRQKQLGLDIDESSLKKSITLLSGTGKVLSDLAQGVKSWANLEITEWEVANSGTENAKLVIKGKRKLSKTDFDNASYGMTKVLSAIGEPLAKIGKLQKGGSSGDPYLDSVYGKNYVSAGVLSLIGVGIILSDLSRGVKEFASMEFTEYEVINPGTNKAKLVPKRRSKISEADMENASLNIGRVLSVVSYAFAKIGRIEDSSSSWISKGVESLKGISEILTSITKGVLSMAYNEIPTFTLINAGTSKAKLVPGKSIILKDSDLEKSSNNISKILSVVSYAFAKIGRKEDTSNEWVSKGVQSLSGISGILNSVIVNIVKIASGEFHPMELINGGTDKAKLVPGKPIKITSSLMISAANTINKVLNALSYSFINFGKKAINNQDSFDKSIEYISKMVSPIKSISIIIENWEKLKNPISASKDITSFITILTSNFDQSKNRNLNDTMKHMYQFTHGIDKIGKNADPLEKAAKNMDKIQKSMKLMKESVNSMDLKKLTLTDAMLHSMAILSKNPEALARSLDKSLQKSFAELIAALKKMTGVTPGGGGGNNNTGNTNTSNTNTVNTNTGTTVGGGGVRKADKVRGDKTGFENSMDVFSGMENNDTYQAMVEALSDVIIRVKNVS